ncbi:MAG: XdhC/CoxI family protein [Peptococcaceae bacterium]|nr:XdhC/CoxI family protein [Peptococcaceae bacterium]
MIKDVLAFAAQKTEEGQKVAFVTVTQTSGSSPASPGQVMAVLADSSISGTVGGGASEYRIIRQSVEAIENGDTIFEFSINHADNGMVCGGSMTGFGNVLGSQARVSIFGGGHIAQSLAKIAVSTGFFVSIIEDRPEFASDFEGVRYVVCSPEEYAKVDPVADSDYVVICTRGHTLDQEALRYCLHKKLKYLGMIGSKNKVAALFESLLRSGISQEELNRVYAPIGLDIANTLPAEIALAILAEIVLVKNQGTPKHRKSPNE